jgi:hypothetical protein
VILQVGHARTVRIVLEDPYVVGEIDYRIVEMRLDDRFCLAFSYNLHDYCNLFSVKKSFSINAGQNPRVPSAALSEDSDLPGCYNEGFFLLLLQIRFGNLSSQTLIHDRYF